ncbi:DNA-binding IclR family transcriptional regulator [Catenuloplanes nepalensis]|uniref:DNA-binding IclR family transcriptional regulator n=1 Tax=Catenuloplanes nepalensis TaxID=587533 RepID=A0ABT9MP73_9ACTN|nr:helix-turn-helix domain-containing protein [Catenuloplanes nepalensis]MDP9793224.1 DNA-binding IclR family transcriptional regulator [Catenuloplanes nepalensis]
MGRTHPADASGRGVLEGAFRLLDALSEVEAAGLSAVARLSGLPKATAYRLLDQLEDLGAVERIRGGYRIGHTLALLSDRRARARRLRAAAHEPSRTLAAQTGCTVGMSVLRDREITCVSSVVAGERLLFDPGLATYPLVTAAGQMLLAERDDTGPPPPMSDLEWRRARAAIRERGTAIDQQSVVSGLSCVAAPVRDPGGRLIASARAPALAVLAGVLIAALTVLILLLPGRDGTPTCTAPAACPPTAPPSPGRPTLGGR